MADTRVPESHRDLLQTDVAVLSTVGADGYPQTTALWFLAGDDGLVRLSLNGTRQKTRNLQRHPHVTFFVLDRTNPMRTLEIRARAEVAPDRDYAFADQLGKKYGGVDLRRMERPGESRVVVTLYPVKVNAIDPEPLTRSRRVCHAETRSPRPKEPASVRRTSAGGCCCSRRSCTPSLAC